MDGTWDDIRLFLAVCEHRSFTAAARSLEITQSSVSRRIARLERQCGEALFHRGRQGAVPTARAMALLEEALPMARAARSFERSLDDGEAGEGAGEGEPVTLTIAAPPGVSADLLAPFAAEFAPLRPAGAPALRLEVRAAIEHVDLGRSEADVAVRLRPPEEPGLTPLAQVDVPLQVFATRDWLARHPGTHDWGSAEWICWSAPRRDLPPRPMLERLVPDFRPVFASDDWLVLKAALRAGLGCMILEPPLDGTGDATQLVRVPFAVSLPPVIRQAKGPAARTGRSEHFPIFNIINIMRSTSPGPGKANLGGFADLQPHLLSRYRPQSIDLNYV